MALYRVLTRLAAGGSGFPDAYKWSYVWYCEASTAVDAANWGASLWVDHMRGAHTNYAYCYEVYASDLVPNTTNYTVLAMAAGVQRATGGSPSSELYLTDTAIRVELTVSGGRPSRKYWRPPLFEEQVGPGGRTVSAGVLTTLNAALTGITNDPDIRDESGNLFTGYVIKSVSTRRLGKFARTALPLPPAFG